MSTHRHRLVAAYIVVTLTVTALGLWFQIQPSELEASAPAEADSGPQPYVGIEEKSDPVQESESTDPQLRGAGDTKDVRVDPDKYYYNAEELADGLLYDLKPLAPLLVAAQNKHGVDAVFLAAVAALESGWGRYPFRPYNLFGFERHDFSSYEEGIDYCAAYLSSEYLDPEGHWYAGYSVDAINRHYNGREHWSQQVKALMRQITNRIEEE